jgi:hypothetical protein
VLSLSAAHCGCDLGHGICRRDVREPLREAFESMNRHHQFAPATTSAAINAATIATTGKASTIRVPVGPTILGLRGGCCHEYSTTVMRIGILSGVRLLDVAACFS